MHSQKLSQRQLEEENRQVEAAKKDRRHFGVLYERYYPKIFLFVYKRIDEEEITADIVSQVFLKAMLNLPRYRFQGVPFSAWLYRIAINEVNQYFRQNKAQRTISLARTDIVNISEEIEEEYSEEGVRRMLGALDSLNEDELQMVEFRYFERLPFKEIAAIYKITENNAKVKVYRILAKLRKRIDTQ